MAQTHSSSVCVVYANDANGTNLEAKKVLWDDLPCLQDEREAVGVYIYWEQQPGQFNRNDVESHECYAIRRAPDRNIEVTWCDGGQGPVAAAARDISFHDDGAGARLKDWPAKLIQAAVAGPVRLLGFDWSHPNFENILITARALADAEPVDLDP